MLPLLLLLCSADPEPTYTVVNRCPVYTVVNKMPVPPALPTDPSKPAPVGYQWVKRGDNPWKLEPASEVAAPQWSTFPTGQRNASHACPRCGHQSPQGTGTWIVRGFNADGSHRHLCPLDGTVWSH